MTTVQDRINSLMKELQDIAWEYDMAGKHVPIRLWKSDFDFLTKQQIIKGGQVFVDGHWRNVLCGPPKKKRRRKRPQDALI